MNGRRIFTGLGVAAVALVAGAISYRHQVDLAATHGQPHLLAAIYPLCTDGLIVVTSIAIATDRAGGFRPRLWALAGFWVGVAVSVLTNWLATSGGLINHGVSAFPALAFLAAVETLGSKPRPRKQPRQITAATSTAPTRYEEMDDVVPVTINRTPRPRTTVPAAAKKTPKTADRIARVVARTPDATAPEIARKLGISDSTVRRHLPAIVTGGLPVTDGESGHVNGHSFQAVDVR